MKLSLSILIVLFISFSGISQNVTYEILENIPYYEKSEITSDTYKKERCVMDLYLPKGMEDFPTVLWFHGGGLTGGEKFIP